MGEMMRKLRRSLAALLAVCVVATSIPNIAWAAEHDADEPLLTAEDVMASAELKLVPEDAPIPYAELMEKAQTAIRTTVPADLDSMIAMALEKDKGKYEETFAGTLFRVGQYGDSASTCVIVFVKPAEEQESYEAYTMTGMEKFVFLYVNRTDTDYNMKINIQDYNAKIVTVPSVSTLYTLYSNDKKASPSNAEGKEKNEAVLNNGGGTSNSGGMALVESTEAVTNEADPSEEVTEAETASAEEKEETGTEASQPEEETGTTAPESTEEVKADVPESTEPAESESESTEATTEAHKETTEEAGTTAAENTSEPETNAITVEPEEKESNFVSENSGSEVRIIDEPKVEEDSEPEVSSGEALVEPEVLSLSRIHHAVPVLGSGNVAPVEGEVYEGEAENPAQEYNMKMGRDRFDDGDEEDAEEYSYTEDYEGPIDQYADYTATVARLSGLLEDETKATPSDASPSNATPSNRLFMSRSARSRSEIMGAVGYSEEQLLRDGENESGTFQVSFYDYASNDVNKNPNKIILGTGDNQKKLLIGNFFDKRSLYGNQNTWMGHLTGLGQDLGNLVMQGIARDTYDENGKIQFNYTTGPIFGKSGAGNNPDMAGIIKYENVDVSVGDDENANVFFVTDADGFVFDSNQRNAVLSDVKNADGTVSHKLEATKGKGAGFFPLDWYPHDKTNPNNYHNEYFGMTLSFDFLMPEDGKITTSQGEEKNMVFEFSGDDDVWVYLKKAGSSDGRLALDLGGIHGETGGRIDFATGLITHDRVWTGSRIGDKGYKPVYWYLYDDKKVGDWIGGKRIEKVVGIPRESWSEYTLDFYYMERGGNASNCKISANMPTIPKDKVAVFKSVAGETNANEFTMDLQIKDKSGEWKTKETKVVGKNQKVEFDEELPKNTEYRVVERTETKPATSWKLGSETSQGLTSPIGTVGNNNLAICFNNYDFAPTISKEAWQEQEEKDLYWIDLGITGNSTVQKTIEGDFTSEKTYYIETVNVKDELSDWVGFELKDELPQIKLKLQKSGDRELKDLEVSVSKIEENKYQVSYKGEKVAIIDGKTITWTAVKKDFDFGNFDENSRVVFSYLVRVSDAAVYEEDVSEYPHPADDDTGTHSLDKGYYSNEFAEAKYTTELFADDKTLTFKKPVVRPLKPEGSLTIKKEVESNLDTNDVDFDFTVQLENVRVKSFLAGKSEPLDRKEPGADGTATLEFSLKAGESYEIKGLNKETTYVVEEGVYSDLEHYSNLKGIVVTPEGRSEINLAGRKVSGSLTDSAGTKKEYSYKESTDVDQATDQILYGDSTIIDEKGEDGWYNQGKLMDKEDPGYYKTINGTIEKEIEPGITTYTWKDGNDEIARADGEAEIDSAQKTVQQWLERNGYTEKVGQNPNAPYAVWGSKKIESFNVSRKQVFNYKREWNWEEEDSKFFARYPGYDYTVGEPGGEYLEKGRWKRNVNYSFYKLEEKRITPSSQTGAGTSVWPWNNQKYSKDDLLEILAADGFSTSVGFDESITYEKTVKRTNYEMFAEGYRYRDYSIETVDIPVSQQALKVEAVFTNSFEEKESISVEKVIDAPDDIKSELDETYWFKVKKLSEITGEYEDFTDYKVEPDTSVTVSSDNSSFGITGEGSAKLFIGGSNKNGSFKIEEIGRGTANAVTWDKGVTGVVSGVIKNGETATCTNHYYNNTLSISKELSNDSYGKTPEEAKWFNYTVTLTDSNGQSLSKVKYQKDSIKDVDFGDTTVDEAKNEITLKNGQFQFIMRAEGILVLENIPAGVKYTVEEGSFANADSSTYYVTQLSKVEQNGAEVSAGSDGTVSSSVKGEFTGEEEQKETIVYTNRISPKKTNITINKKIVNQDTGATVNDGNGETFIFEITNNDENSPGYGEVFYATIVIKDGEGTATISDVMESDKYAIVEMDNMRFRPYGGQNSFVINTTANEGEHSVLFRNYRDSSDYFTDTDVAINKVTANGFKRQSSQAPEGLKTEAAALPLAVLKHDEILFGEGSFDSEDIPYYGL